MADELQTEDILDRDFLLFMSVAKAYYSGLTNEKDKTLCMRWLTKLCGWRLHGITEKRSRNIFLSRLLINMQEGKITCPFLTLPTDGPLPEAKIFFDLPKPKKHSSPQIDDTIKISDDYQERSADGRTYVAIRCLPKNQGACAFVAISIDKEEDNSLNAAPCAPSMDNSKLNRTKTLQKLMTVTLEDHAECHYITNVEDTITGDITELCDAIRSLMLHGCNTCRNEISFYDVLLTQIDDEIKGVSVGNNNLVEFLITRLAWDLKKMHMIKCLFKLSPEQQHFKLLEILRQKLLIGRQEAKRQYMLMEMAEQIESSTATEYSPCSKQPAEYMWQLAVTKPLPDVDIEKLYTIYPKDAISTYLCLIVDDRQAILQNARRRQNNLVDDMRLDVYKEIQLEKTEYNKARAAYREWNKILSMVEKLMYEAKNQLRNDDRGALQEKRNTLVNMITSIKETENLVVQEAHCGEVAIEKILDANLWTLSTQQNDGKDLSWEIKNSVQNLKRDTEMYKILISNQRQRIEQLKDKLGYARKNM